MLGYLTVDACKYLVVDYVKKKKNQRVIYYVILFDITCHILIVVLKGKG